VRRRTRSPWRPASRTTTACSTSPTGPGDDDSSAGRRWRRSAGGDRPLAYPDGICTTSPRLMLTQSRASR
jgi:hypothetical protein